MNDALEQGIEFRACFRTEQRVGVAGKRLIDAHPVVGGQKPSCQWKNFIFLGSHVLPMECCIGFDGLRERRESIGGSEFVRSQCALEIAYPTLACLMIGAQSIDQRAGFGVPQAQQLEQVLIFLGMVKAFRKRSDLPLAPLFDGGGAFADVPLPRQAPSAVIAAVAFASLLATAFWT